MQLVAIVFHFPAKVSQRRSLFRGRLSLPSLRLWGFSRLTKPSVHKLRSLQTIHPRGAQQASEAAGSTPAGRDPGIWGPVPVGSVRETQSEPRVRRAARQRLPIGHSIAGRIVLGEPGTPAIVPKDPTP